MLHMLSISAYTRCVKFLMEMFFSTKDLTCIYLEVTHPVHNHHKDQSLQRDIHNLHTSLQGSLLSPDAEVFCCIIIAYF